MNTSPIVSVTDAIRSRRSHRHYRPDPIPTEVLDQLLELTLEAPSAWNYQGRAIVVASDSEARAGLVKATGEQPHPREAPVVLVFLAELDAWRRDNTDISSRVPPSRVASFRRTSSNAVSNASTPSKTQ